MHHPGVCRERVEVGWVGRSSGGEIGVVAVAAWWWWEVEQEVVEISS